MLALVAAFAAGFAIGVVFTVFAMALTIGGKVED
jgi:hypothetical protein